MVHSMQIAVLKMMVLGSWYVSLHCYTSDLSQLHKARYLELSFFSNGYDTPSYRTVRFDRRSDTLVDLTVRDFGLARAVRWCGHGLKCV